MGYSYGKNCGTLAGQVLPAKLILPTHESNLIVISFYLMLLSLCEDCMETGCKACRFNLFKGVSWLASHHSYTDFSRLSVKLSPRVALRS